MSGSQRLGTAVLSIDLELDLEHHEQALARRLDEVRSRLVAVTHEYSVPVTWAVADPIHSAATESILSAGCGHEISVLGDQAWLGRGCGRARLARELARRFCAPRKIGMPVSTLILRNVEQVVDLDLLNEHGVAALCGPATEAATAARTLEPPPTRFGLWQPPIAWKLSLGTEWWSAAIWRVRREISRTIRRGSLLHLRLDAVRLVDAPPHALKIVGEILRHIAAKRDASRLAIDTIGRLAAAALNCRAGVPSRSALRPAA